MMSRCAAAVAVSLFTVACGTTPDDRPATFEFVSLAVLAPACATVACHSTSTNASGFAFDTLSASRQALRKLVTAGDPQRSQLIDVITRNAMPPDEPMADQDLALLEKWIADGAPGL
jgi:cytochrome c